MTLPRRLSVAFIALIALLSVAACASPVGKAETPAQKAWAAYAVYLVYFEAMVEWCEDPAALAVVCDQALAADDNVLEDVEALEAVLDAGGDPDAELAARVSRALSAASIELRSALLRHGVFTEPALDQRLADGLRRQGDR